MNWATIKTYIWDWPPTKEKMEKTMFVNALMFFFILNMADIWTTLIAISKYGIQAEVNPIGRVLFPNLWLFIGVKIAYTSFLVWIMYKINKWSTTFGHTLAGISIGMMAITVLQNCLIII